MSIQFDLLCFIVSNMWCLSSNSLRQQPAPRWKCSSSFRFFDWPNQQSMGIYIFYHNSHAVSAHAPQTLLSVVFFASPLSCLRANHLIEQSNYRITILYILESAHTHTYAHTAHRTPHTLSACHSRHAEKGKWKKEKRKTPFFSSHSVLTFGDKANYYRALRALHAKWLLHDRHRNETVSDHRASSNIHVIIHDIFVFFFFFCSLSGSHFFSAIIWFVSTT